MCSLSLNSIVFTYSEPEIIELLRSENYFSEFTRLSYSLSKTIIKIPIKNIKKQNPNPAPVYPFPLPSTITLRIEPALKQNYRTRIH